MALISSKPTRFGDSIQVTYWRVAGCQVDFLSRSCTVHVVGYANEAARRSNRHPMESFTFDWRDVDFPFDAAVLGKGDMDIQRAVYEKLMGMEDWKGAVSDEAA